MSFKLVCEICEKDFDGRTRIVKVCSEECRKQMHKNYHRNLYIKEHGESPENCLFCGVKLEGRRQKRFCSEKCKDSSRYRRINPFVEKICPCGKKFETRGKETIYCSPSCVNTFCKSHDNVILTCKQCGKEFERKYIHRDKLFCSRSCATIHQNNIMWAEGNNETRNKLSNSQKERYKIVPHPWIGRHHSDETKEKISKFHIENETFKGENPCIVLYGH